MLYRFEFSAPADRDFAYLERHIQRRILTKLQFFESLDEPLVHAKKLSGVKNIYRFRIGDYRVLVSPVGGKTFIILLVVKIGHRREVYDK